MVKIDGYKDYYEIYNKDKEYTMVCPLCAGDGILELKVGGHIKCNDCNGTGRVVTNVVKRYYTKRVYYEHILLCKETNELVLADLNIEEDYDGTFVEIVERRGKDLFATKEEAQAECDRINKEMDSTLWEV